MSRKQRVLKGLRTVESGLRQATNNGSQETLAAVSRDLTATRDVCRQGLSENSYVKYGEVYDGLILATQQMAGSANMSLEEDALALCQELLRYLIQEAEGEKSFKKDIFFLPYKASMWDSLESVWKAAYEDKEHCNAYVMPIPYADLNPDRSVAEWHCERGAFPKYVPTLDWQQVDLKEWHPDVIFYHNPYDDFNHVTSVDSRYYSGKLKECADKLVYIPYFVLEEPHPGNETEEENISHFILNPGVVNADQVIVQSEAMREVYINVLTKNTNQKDRGYWEARISGAGSPKIEKVLTSKKEDFEMPEAWKKLVEGRKVILYNTSLGAMLELSDKVCDKLRYVFDIFRDRRDVVLWWRPHPLMKATFHSMRPQFEAEYLSLEKHYIEEGWGIYDDSPDLHRAICWSDAYYGDGSSVLDLYKFTSNPIMIQKNYLHHRIDKTVLAPSAMVEIGKNIFFTDYYIDGLYQFDTGNFQIRCLAKFQTYTNTTELLYHKIIASNEKLYCLPHRANSIGIYDISKKQVESVKLPTSLIGNEAKFSCGIVVNNQLVLFGYGISEICICDLRTFAFKFLKQCASKVKRMLNRPSQGLYIRDAVLSDGVIYAVSLYGNFILIIDIRSFQYKIVDFADSDCGYVSILHHETNLWLVPYDGKFLIRYSLADQEYELIPTKTKQCDWAFIGGFINNDVLYLVPCNSCQLKQISLSNYKVNEMMTQIVNRSCSMPIEDSPVAFLQHRNRIFLSKPYKPDVLIFDIKQRGCFSCSFIADFSIELSDEVEVYSEGISTDLLWFFGKLKKHRHSLKKNSCGYEVYKYVVRQGSV